MLFTFEDQIKMKIANQGMWKYSSEGENIGWAPPSPLGPHSWVPMYTVRSEIKSD